MIGGVYTGAFACCGASQITGLASVSKEYLKHLLDFLASPAAKSSYTNPVQYNDANLPGLLLDGVQAVPQMGVTAGHVPPQIRFIVTHRPIPTYSVFAVSNPQQTKALEADFKESGFHPIMTFDSNHGAGPGNRGLTLWIKPRNGANNFTLNNSVGGDASAAKLVELVAEYEGKFKVQETNISQLRHQIEGEAKRKNLFHRALVEAAPRSKNLREIIAREGILL